MTYKQLAEKILQMTEEQQSSDVTLMDHDEEFHECRLEFATDNEDCPAAGVLDSNHPYLSMRTLV